MELKHLFLRDTDDDDNDRISPAALDFLIVLLVLVFVAMCLVSFLFFYRRVHRGRVRQQQQQQQPLLPFQHHRNHNNDRRLTVTTLPTGEQAITIHHEKPPAFDQPVPEIRLTFPEEEDDKGRRQSGRVVVVRIGESGSVGLEPCDEDDHLPPYDAEGFHSLDLERMGGLKEKGT